MKGEYPSSIESALANLSEGQMKVRLSDPDAGSILLSNHFDCRVQGKGEMQILSLFPGVELCFNRFIGGSDTFDMTHAKTCENQPATLVETGWEMQEGLTVYLGRRPFAAPHVLLCSFADAPAMGYYEGTFLSIDLSVFCSAG